MMMMIMVRVIFFLQNIAYRIIEITFDSSSRKSEKIDDLNERKPNVSWIQNPPW